jgi:hypothetical protein
MRAPAWGAKTAAVKYFKTNDWGNGSGTTEPESHEEQDAKARNNF